MTPDDLAAIRARTMNEDTDALLAEVDRLTAELIHDANRFLRHAEHLRECQPQRERLKAEVDRLTDNPEWDATEGAHPAWWRGCDHGVARERARILAAVEGLPVYSSDPESWADGWVYRQVVDRAAVLAIVKGETA
jgi:hypothetical protein